MSRIKNVTEELNNFKADNNLSNEQFEKLQTAYNSPNNFYSNMEFVDWLYLLKEQENGEIFYQMINEE